MDSLEKFNKRFSKDLKEDLKKLYEKRAQVRKGPLGLTDCQEAQDILEKRKRKEKNLYQKLQYYESCLRSIRGLFTLNRDAIDLAEHAIAPINTLPAELLGMILSLVCAEAIDEYGIGIRAASLRCVCGRWQGVIDKESSLWNHVRLCETTTLFLVTHSLECSGERPLSLDISGKIHIPDEDEWSPTAALLAHSGRWRTACIDGDLGWEYVQLVDTYPNLHSLCMKNTFVTEWTITTPSLRHLSLGRLAATLSPALPWQGLQILSFTPSRYEDLQCISLCTDLRRLELDLDASIDLSGNGSVAPVQHLAVTVVVFRLLQLTEGPNNPFGGFIGKLVFPELIELRVTDTRDCVTFDWLLRDVRQFVVHSGCHLQSLDIKGAHCPLTELLSLLRSQPSIRQLGIHDPSPQVLPSGSYNCPVSEGLLRALDPRHQNTNPNPMLPNLHSLELTVCQTIINPEHFLRMIERRQTDIGDEIVLLSSVRLDIKEREAWGGWSPSSGEMKGQWQEALTTLKMNRGLYTVIFYQQSRLSWCEYDPK
jgi:hypothetical protein